jgi:hypothetical protein
MHEPRLTSWHHHKWVILLTNLVILLCLAWFLYTPKRPSYEQLAAVRLGMTLEEAKRLLAPAPPVSDYTLAIVPVFTPPGDPKQSVARGNLGMVTAVQLAFIPDSELKATLIADGDTSWLMDPRPNGGSERFDNGLHHLWVGQDHLLWVRVNDRGEIAWLRLLPVRREGGGPIAWLKHQYRTWFGQPARPAVVTAPWPTKLANPR